MGLFDSQCAVTGISLASQRVAGVPLIARGEGDFVEGGPVVIGVSNRGGGIDGHDLSRGPFALVSANVLEAIKAHASDLRAFMTTRGLTLAPQNETGAQHTDGDVLELHAAAVGSFGDLPWMQEALSMSAAAAEDETKKRLGREAPSAGWLARSTSSFYGAVVGVERRASTSFDGLRADIEHLGTYAFDPETLTLAEGLFGVLVVQRGAKRFVDLRGFVDLVFAGRRARLDQREEAEALYASDGDEDPRFELDVTALRPLLPDLESPLAESGVEVLVGSPFGDPPVWSEAGETRYGLTVFARVESEGWSEPPPRVEPVLDPSISDDAIEAELRAGRLIGAIQLYRKKCGAGLADAKAAMEALQATLLKNT